MTQDNRITVTDWNSASSWGTAGGGWQHTHAGKAFLFLGREAFSAPGLSWIPKLFGATARPRVVSLLGSERVDLPGLTVKPGALPALHLSSVTCDKAIYREGRDEVRLLVLDLLAPGAERVLEVSLNGQEFGAYPVTPDDRGAALLSLRDLPAGDYRAKLRGAQGPSCEFSVAVYRLAPLVASLIERRVEGAARLHVRLRLEAYGVPVEGPVFLEITDRGSRIGRERVEARGGFAEASLPLTGEGPHAINAQLASDPGRTATVPIVGSRAFEREQTVFSTLGIEVLGALLPGDASRPVRGVYLEEGARRSSPFVLERVDARKARLRATTAVETARLVAVDPAFPRRRPDAIDPATAQHPAHEDQAYVRAEKLFQQGKYTEARALFELTLASRPVAHPNYAYYVACCHARQGDRARAVAALRTAFEHGWSDLHHLASDDDLASLRGYGPFEAFKAGGAREVCFDDIVSGQTIEIEGPGPISLLAVGAFVDGVPWEGWAALLAPEETQARVVVPELPTPNSEVRVDVDTGGADATVYLLIKDARLLSPDTPVNRLAGQIKRCVADTSSLLGVGQTARPLSELISQPRPVYVTPTYNPPMPPPMYNPPPVPMSAAPVARAPGGFGGPPPPAPAMGPPPAQPAAMRPPAAPSAVGKMMMTPPSPAAPPPPAAPRRQEAREEAEHSATSVADAARPREDERPRAAVTEEPEILFAGLIEARGGQASATVKLGPAAADYVVEAFVFSGLDWKMSEARFRAEKLPSLSLEVPPYVHRGDAALGRVVVATASDRMRVRLLRDGVDVPLLHEGRVLAPGEVLPASSAELSFIATPGDYSAVLEDALTGAADWVGKRVDEPGKLRRLARQLRLLGPGERVGRGDDPSVVGLRVLPGLDQPFTVLIDATADYGHACCEQTAAKLLAACGMYVFSDTPAQRSRAESIILAGVRREATMWLPGRGFKMYPESPSAPESYWGPKAARYLWFLATVRDASTAPSKALLRAIDEGLRMAEDGSRAYRLAWPPSSVASCEEAYMVARFGRDQALRERALAFATQQAGRAAGGAVAQRVELAYAAATLLRLGGKAAWPQAIALANAVTRAFQANGRLYSTVDSVAAIALMAELKAAGVVGRGGRAIVNGQNLPVADAVAFEGEIREIHAPDGVVAVEVARIVEEDWGGLQMSVPVRVALERGGRPTRRCVAGDALDLRVTLESGYKAGDLLWVCLPDGLSRVVGGGQVKMFSVDFEGKNEVVVPLAATGITVDGNGASASQRFAVCVRNMFEEERAGNPGLLDVQVEPPGDGGSGLGKLLRGVKALFGG